MTLGFKSYISARYDLMGRMCWPALAECLESRLVQTNLVANELLGPRDIAFIETGALRLVEVLKGERITTALMIRGSLFRFKGTETAAEIVCERRTWVTILRYDLLLDACRNSPGVMVLYLKILEDVVARQMGIKRIFMHQNGFERVDIFMSKYSSYFKDFLMRDLASFLGISAVSFSRLKNQVSS